MGFSERFPRWITLLIAIVQLVITAAIIALEIVSDYIDVGHGTIWVGLWSGIIFIITFLLMFFITCCCRGRCCAFYILIMNIISGLLACVIIYFDQIFMNDPCKCYLGDQICCSARSVPSLQQNYSAILQECDNAITNGNISQLVCPSVPYDKVVYVKAQLGCGVGMLVTCGVYAVLFVFASFGCCFGRNLKYLF